MACLSFGQTPCFSVCDEERDEIFILNRTFLVRVGDISGEFGRAMVRILARRS